MVLALPSALPLPLLSTILDALFSNFQAPTISLMSTPALTAVAAGLRAALVVDIGWEEAVVTGVYELRELQSHRTVRATKLLCRDMLKILGAAVAYGCHIANLDKMQSRLPRVYHPYRRTNLPRA